jgi:superfamily I DNA/RNA helicase
MATVVLAKEFQKNLNLEGSLKPRAWDLLRKLSSDQDLTGLDLKIPQGAKDPRVRTARVNDNYRAVLFAAGSEDDQYFLLVAIRPHDDAYKYAAQVTMRLNPANGIFEVLRDVAPAPESSSSARRKGSDDKPLLLPFRPDELVEVGILSELAERAVTLRDEDELQELCLHAPEWQASALLDLAYGVSLDDVRRSYAGTFADGEIALESVPTDVDDPKHLRESLNQAASQMEFVVVEGDEHLRRMLDGDFAAWRTFLHPEQRELVERDRKGAYRVTGGAGTGKTVVAMHRAVVLAERNPQARVLVTTFTKNLAAQLMADLARLAGPGVLDRIQVRGVNQLAREVVARKEGAGAQILSDRDQQRLWQDAVNEVRDLPPADRELMTPYFLMGEYQHVILGMDVADRDRYLVEPRQGRGVRLNRLQRARVWRVVEEFNRLLAQQNRTTHAIIVAKAAALAKSNELPMSNTYDHVVIDEAQDLSPAHWRLLRGVVPTGPNDLFICEDAHQRIYGERVVLSRYGIETRGRSRRLTLNYRTTRQILHYATRVLSGNDFVDLAGEDESTSRYRSLLAGREPIEQGARSWAEEKAFVVRTIQGWLAEDPSPAPASLAVLASQQNTRDELARALQDTGIPAVIVSTDAHSDAAGVQVATMHRAKGTEFARVIVAAVDADKIPSKYRMNNADPDERSEIELRDRCLLYVACTRARDQLVMTWTGDPSPFLLV